MIKWLALGFVAGWLYANRETIAWLGGHSSQLDAAGQLVSGLQGLGVSL